MYELSNFTSDALARGAEGIPAPASAEWTIVPRRTGAAGARYRIEVVLDEALLLNQRRLLTTIRVAFAKATTYGIGIAIDRVLHDVIEVDLGRRGVVSHDLHGRYELGRRDGVGIDVL
jgi:hypothetical protein